MKRDLYETASGDNRRYEVLARQAGASSNRELADYFRGLRDENRRRDERARGPLARRVAG
jgi:hypothetical protein